MSNLYFNNILKFSEAVLNQVVNLPEYSNQKYKYNIQSQQTHTSMKLQIEVYSNKTGVVVRKRFPNIMTVTHFSTMIDGMKEQLEILFKGVTELEKKLNEKKK